MFTVLPVVLSSLCSTAVQDPSPGSGDWLRREGNEITIEIKGPDAPTLLELVRACEKTTGPRFYLLRSEEDLLTRERLNAIAPMKMPAERFFGFVQGILRTHDMACAVVAEEPNLVVRAVRLQGDGLHAMKSSVRFIDAGEIAAHAQDHAMLYSSYIPLAHIDPQNAAQLLGRSFANNALEGFGSLTGGAGAQGMYVIGYGPTLQGIAELLRRVDVPRAAEDLGVLSCEVWQVEGAELVARIEELAARGEGAEALKAVQQMGEGAKRLARYQGPAGSQAPTQVSSHWSGGEERLSADIELMPSVVEGDLLRVSMSLQVKGTSQQSEVNARISGTAQLRRGGVQVMLSSSQRGATIAFLGLR